MNNRPLLRRRDLLAGAAAAAGSLALPSFAADTWPGKPLRWVVGYAPGGATDLVARTIGEQLGNALGQRFVIDNRPGAGGTLGARLVATAPADGYTLGSADNGTLFNNWSLYPKLDFTLESFDYVAMMGRFPLVLAVNGNVPAKSFDEWVQWVKRTPHLSYASPGVGSPHHIAMALLEDRLGVKLQHVAYKGDSAAVVDVIGGAVPFMLLGVATARQYMKDERIRFLGVTWDKRISSMPDVPTFDEVGVRNFEAYAEQGIVMPAGTSREIVQRMNREVAKVLGASAVRERLEAIGMYPVTRTPEEFRAYVIKQAGVAGELIKRKGITVG